MSQKIPISEASKILGVAQSTLRRWEDEGKITPTRTANGHRRYDLSELLNVKKEGTLTIGYARVSSSDQKEDLKRQCEVLELFCANNGWQFKIIQDFGSGLNYQKKGLKQLIKLICSQEIERLVITHKDRLLRFGSELIFSLCEEFGVEIVLINQTNNSTYEEDLTNDVLEIITVFSARLYGSRSQKNRKIIEELKDVSSKL
ncbi:MAG: IS607 family transposase [Gomphosphaeria aponina SAG 52.96 = DSM 107014]|uniref:IS607 family transposase n=1 Tax=Gomphosphaeria aponina SAG 52.96 = DSM 107014 TaxID=1521640 RepID=A0A941JNI6_9CHRO|nr:IS607 family transposase [Gomphosphaeria aponina SAG 52.96 = DSM 107014]